MKLVNNKLNFLQNIETPSVFPFPYTPEEFSEKEKKILLKFFTNWDKPIFAIHNLPDEVIGAMFSRYSRTAKSVRRLFLDEFWDLQKKVSIKEGTEKAKASERTTNFYKRVFAEYGDDSVIQMGSVHIAFEYVSQLTVKAIEDTRVSAAYIEKSTRYVDFGNKAGVRYLYIDVPEIKNSDYYDEYLEWNEKAFNFYKDSYQSVFEYFRNKYPLKEQLFINPATGGVVQYRKIKDSGEKELAEKAYERALKARTFDSIRLFLPLTVVSNLGAHFSGQAAENVINKMISSDLAEVKLAGIMAYQELVKITPNFLLHIDHKYGEMQRKYKNEIKLKSREFALNLQERINNEKEKGSVKIIDWESNADVKIASQIIFTSNTKGLSKSEIVKWAEKTKKEELKSGRAGFFSPTLLKVIQNSLPKRTEPGFNRRHKLSRAFEHVYVEIEFLEDYGVYKDLQRNRMSSTERGVYLADKVKIPKEFKDKNLKGVLRNYKELAATTKKLQEKINSRGDNNLKGASEYIMLHGNLVRFNVKANLRQWVFFAELRTIEGGHPSYRTAMQKAAKLIIQKYPFMKKLFAHVNWTKDTGLGRLRAEIKTQEKLSKIIDTRI